MRSNDEIYSQSILITKFLSAQRFQQLYQKDYIKNPENPDPRIANILYQDGHET